jgi:hypothetical protein
MATLTVIKPGYLEANLGAGAAAAASGDVVPNDGKTMLRFTNSGSARTVTVTAQKASLDTVLTLNNVLVTVPATTGDVIVGPFPKHIFDNASGQLALTYDAETALTIWCISSGG